MMKINKSLGGIAALAAALSVSDAYAASQKDVKKAIAYAVEQGDELPSLAGPIGCSCPMRSTTKYTIGVDDWLVVADPKKNYLEIYKPGVKIVDCDADGEVDVVRSGFRDHPVLKMHQRMYDSVVKRLAKGEKNGQ